MNWTKETALQEAQRLMGKTAWVDTEPGDGFTSHLIGLWDVDSNCQGVMYSGHSWEEAIDWMRADVASPMPNPMLKMAVWDEEPRAEEDDGYL